MENILKNTIQNTLKVTVKFIKWIIGLLLLLYLCSGIYSISPNKIGVLVRFGKVIDPKVMPGIHYSLPRPIDTIYKVPVKVIHHVFIDDFYQSNKKDSASQIFYNATGLPSYCVSGDNNIVMVSFLVKYTITSPVKYLFNVKDHQQLLKDIASSTIIHCLASMPVDEILTYGKKKVEDCIKTNLQNNLDYLNSGLGVSFVELKDVNPPKEVQNYFDDVINATIDKKKSINEAESYRNQKIADANAEAERLIQQAEAYKKEKIAHAEGETQRFLTQLAEYNKCKDITKKRLYLDFISSIYPYLKNKIIVENKEGKKLLNIRVLPKYSD